MIAAGKFSLGQALLGITDLDVGQHVFCILMGLSVIPFHFAINKYLDESKFKFTKNIIIEREDPGSRISILIGSLSSF
jgi:hypothetical protein